MNVLVLVMGGSGTRLGESVPKQYIEIEGLPIFGYILKKYNDFDSIDKIVIVSNEKWIDYVERVVDKLKSNKVVGIVAGGVNRSSSIKNGLKKIKEFASEEDVILFHDATHPYVDENGTDKVIKAIKEYGAATLVSFNYDTVYEKDDNDMIKAVVPRNNIVAGASPEGFKFGTIFKIYETASEKKLEQMTSAGAMALENGLNMKTIECNFLNLKITYKKDLELFKKTINNYFFE